jgi:hypothetical protein
MAGKFCEGVEAMWVEALNFLEFWLPFFQEKGRRKIIEKQKFLYGFMPLSSQLPFSRGLGLWVLEFEI